MAEEEEEEEAEEEEAEQPWRSDDTHRVEGSASSRHLLIGARHEWYISHRAKAELDVVQNHSDQVSKSRKQSPHQLVSRKQ